MGSSLEKINLASLHGFLGTPSDWELVQSSFMVSPLARRFEWWSVDYFKTPILSPQWPLAEWARHFNQKMQLKFSEGPRVLIGYSLGGRLALQALRAQPDLYQAVICISTNPGLTKDKERAERRQNDLQWSQKFFKTPWPQLMQEWNAQPVFRDSQREPSREEANYDRELLSKALTSWSLSQQEDFRSLICEQQQKILWLSGDKDIKFLSLAMELKRLCPALATETISHSSHRVLFDNPGELSAKIISFLGKLFG